MLHAEGADFKERLDPYDGLRGRWKSPQNFRGYVAPRVCQANFGPTPHRRPAPGWIQEVKHDGFRMMVRRDGDRVRAFTRNGNNWAARYPAKTAAAARVPPRSFLIDGEVVVADAQGVVSFELLRGLTPAKQAFVWAFDCSSWTDRISALSRSSGAGSSCRRCSSARGSAWRSTTRSPATVRRCTRRPAPWPRGHPVEAGDLALSLRPLGRLGEGQEPGERGRAA